MEPSKSTNKCILIGLGISNTQHMRCFARLSLRKHTRATLIFPSKFQKTLNAILCGDGRRTHSKWDVLLSWAFENTIVHFYLSSGVPKDCWTSEYTRNALLGWAEPLQTQPIHCFAWLNFRKHRVCNVYLSSAFSALLRTLLFAQLSRTRSKSLIVRASLWQTNVVRLHSRLRRDMWI